MQSPTTSGSTTLRYAIIGGAAGIAPTHIRALQQLPGAQIVGLSDINAEGGAARAAEVGCPFFVDHREMLAELKPDVAVICAPHPFHPPLALDAFAAGAHVLVEKPIAVSVGEADTMIAAAERAGRLLVVSFQQRFRPAVEHIRGLIDAGELGELVRVLCVEPWYRPAAYYSSASWRGTWKGEGGGVLMNQAPHTLDLLCAFVGLPHKVWGWTRTIAHAIEVEDTAQAMLEYSNGAPGYLNINTVEHGLKQRIEIIGDRAALEWVGDQLTIHRFKRVAERLPRQQHRHVRRARDRQRGDNPASRRRRWPPGGLPRSPGCHRHRPHAAHRWQKRPHGPGARQCDHPIELHRPRRDAAG